MEQQLVSKWKNRVILCDKCHPIPSNTVIVSCLIQECANFIISTSSEFSSVAAAATALLCITMEADFMCELLRRRAKSSEFLIQQSSVIRICALSFINCKDHQSDSQLPWRGTTSKILDDQDQKRITDREDANRESIGIEKTVILNCYQSRSRGLATRDRCLRRVANLYC